MKTYNEASLSAATNSTSSMVSNIGKADSKSTKLNLAASETNWSNDIPQGLKENTTLAQVIDYDLVESLKYWEWLQLS